MEANDFFARQQEQVLRYERHKELLKIYQKGVIPPTNILWHDNFDDIDFSLQRDRLNPQLHIDGFTILKDVKIEELFMRMDTGIRLMYQKKQLYNGVQNEMLISKIWDYWLNNQKLIPPTIVIYDQIYINNLCPGSIPSSELKAIDGKHRLNVAYCLGAVTVPIIVLNRQLTLIKQLLNIG